MTRVADIAPETQARHVHEAIARADARWQGEQMIPETTQDMPTRAAAAFAEQFGYQPEGVWSAPGRVNLIGDHTDYNEGFVLPFGIDRRTWVAVALRRDHVVRVASSAGGGTVEHPLLEIAREAVGGWSAYPLGTAWGLGQVGADLEHLAGFDAWFISDVPLGAGLSSSAAIECALAVALVELWGLRLDRTALVEATHRAENEIVGAPTGILDQSASLLAEAGSALFLDCRTEQSRLVPLDLAAAGLEVIAIDTAVEHAHATGAYADRRTACERASQILGVKALRDVRLEDLDAAAARLDPVTLRRVWHVVTENERVLATVTALEAGDFAGVGTQMAESHASLRVDFEVSIAELDAAVAASLAAGALGARMTGGGFGGTAIALVDRASADALVADVRKTFADQGFREPSIFTVTPSQGARRDR